MRTLGVLTAIFAAGSIQAVQAQSLVYTFGDEALYGDGFGRSVAGAGDVDGDGFDDVAVGSHFDDHNGTNAGAVRVHSGRTGALLWTSYGEQPGSYLGWSIDGLGDVDGDGRSEVIAGAPLFDTASNIQNDGEALILSGASGLVLKRHFGHQPGAQVGDCVCGLGDIDGDGRGDYALGIPHYDTSSYLDGGRIEIFSGATYTQIANKNGTADNDHFGSALARVKSGPTPAASLIAIGVPGFGATDKGRVYINDGNGDYVAWADGAYSNGQLGTAVASVGDLDGDGVRDIAAGEPYADVGLTNCGRVVIYSAGSVQFPVLRIVAGMASNENFGAELASIGDFDSDGFDDLLVGVPLADWNNADSGRAAVISSASGLQLTTWSGHTGDRLGQGVGAADVNGDGELDIVIGAPEASAGYDQAYVRLLRAPLPATYCTAKSNSVGCNAAVLGFGVASRTLLDNFHAHAFNVLNQKSGLLFWGLAPATIPFHGGTLCAQPPLRRTAVQNSGGSSSGSNCTGEFDFHFTHAYLQSNSLTAGTVVRAQYWYRDPGFAPPNNSATSNALEFTVAP